MSLNHSLLIYDTSYSCLWRYPDRIPQDKIPQDKIPQHEKWTKSHNIESWQGDGFKLLDGTTDSFIWLATSIRRFGRWSRQSKCWTGKSWRWSPRTWLVSHLGSESDAGKSVCRLASSRSVRIASLDTGQSGSSWPASGTTFAGRPVTGTRNRGLIWHELCRMNKLYKLCDLNQLNKYRTNY